MDTRQVIAIIAPPLLIGVSYLIFHSLNRFLPHPWAWYLGLVSYWIIWGGIFPLTLIGWTGVKEVIKPQKPTWRIVGLLAIPILGSAIYKLIPGMNFQQQERRKQ